MDRIFARRLERDEKFRSKLVKIARDYLKVGRDSLAYWSADFDVAYDLLSCYSPLAKQDFEQLERGHPKRFVLPMTATQITTMTTYVAQVLFGQDTPHKVEGRGPEDEVPAEFVNQLLRWNAEQQPTYLLGYLWAQDAIALNRGIFYNSWAPVFKPEVVTELVDDPETLDEQGLPQKYPRARRVNKLVGGFCKMHLVSPYDFVCDPALPLWRLNDMRFCGHRTTIPVAELQRRSKLPMDHPAYVMPWAVKEVEALVKKGSSQLEPITHASGAMPPTSPNVAIKSRTAYERTRSTNPTGTVQADKNDAGNVECWEVWVKLVPQANEIYEGDEPVIFQFLVGAGSVLLSANESSYAHGMFPYSVGEGRPSAHFQFSPGWVGMLKGIQDHVDWLKHRHQEALSRTIGNIFVYDPASVDVTDFSDPDKEGLLIALKPEAAGKRIADVFQQVTIHDMTENFQQEAMSFVQYAESVTAANSSMQGSIGDTDASATQFAGTQQMAAGRLTSVARVLSSEALVPQTRQFVSNFQQFLDQPQTVRFRATRSDLPPELSQARSLELSKDTVQGEFDYIAHDGTLPGTDGRKVAAITRLLESASLFPQLFTPAPGNLDPRLLVIAGAKASGLNVESFYYPASQIPDPGAMPEAGLPQIESPMVAGAPGVPGPQPETPPVPMLPDVALSPISAVQPRPENM